ncbi:MAG: FIST C-terminal domain-containing protein [Synergistaceae bacterium]|nr:FIST C-terminal domain-containing protein [Synergistaceae bacterium]
MEQLELKGGLLENSIGIVTCYSHFIESGTLKAVCDALPFGIVGSTTLSNATPGSVGNMLMTVLVLTGDDVSFEIGLTEPILSNDENVLREAYESASAKLGRRPSLMLSFVPLLMNVSSDFYVETFTRISGGVPNFGMLSVDHNSDYRESQVICNGEAYLDRYAFVLVSGGITPRFFSSHVFPEKIYREKGVVTASSGNHLQEVNGRPVVDFLLSLGLKKGDDGSIIGINSFPFIVDYNDGTTPILRAVFAQTPEGYAVCGGDIPTGSTLSVGFLDEKEVIATAVATLEDVIASGDFNCAIMCSCIGRYFYLGYNPDGEIDEVRRFMDVTGIPYLFSYSGGELCPVYAIDGGGESTTNRNHNNTFVICTL